MYSLIYVFVFCILLIFVLPLTRKNNISTYNSLSIYDSYFNEIAVLFVLLIFLGFRGYIYTDYISYYPFYEKIPSLWKGEFSLAYFNTNHWEKGYLLYALICKTISPSYVFFQFISTFIDFLLFRYAIHSYLPKQSRVMAYVLFFSFYGLVIEINLLRNVKAIMIFIISLRYINKSLIKYLLLISISCLFHRWSVIYFPLYFILGKQWNRKTILFFWFLGNVLCIFQITYIKNFILVLTEHVSGNIYIEAIKLYLNSDDYGKAYALGLGWLERQISFFLIFHYGKNVIRKNSISNVLMNIAYLYFFVWLYFSEVSIFIERISLLFVFGFWFTIPYIYSTLSRKNKIMWLLYLFPMGMLKLAIANNQVFYNYKLIFFDDFEVRKHIFWKNEKML